jgi:hypothetical protein
VPYPLTDLGCGKQITDTGNVSSVTCEANADRPCAWQLIYKRLKEIGQLDRLKEIKKPKNWRSSQSGGCRKIIREDHRV